jgi:hypothetical protein
MLDNRSHRAKMTALATFRRATAQALIAALEASGAKLDPRVTTEFLEAPESEWIELAALSFSTTASSYFDSTEIDSLIESAVVDESDECDAPTNGWPGYPYL